MLVKEKTSFYLKPHTAYEYMQLTEYTRPIINSASQEEKK